MKTKECPERYCDSAERIITFGSEECKKLINLNEDDCISCKGRISIKTKGGNIESKKPTIVMLTKGKKLKNGDFVVRDDGITIIKNDGGVIHGPNNVFMPEGNYFRVMWK